ncbi:ATP-binding protein [Sulfurospirillum arcachonense]|uniref:ATP-binding protein n=1 Tax=Sulfurospirillum arcachonense TaxID=57666 RepID=UPI00046ADC86|nr:ATP-binding protein [Sulfurospirillum arcachonense]
MQKSKKEILFILFSFIILGMFVLASKFYNIYKVNTINTLITDIYTHPLQVSNASLTIELELYKIRHNIKYISLIQDNKEILSLIKEIKESEKIIDTNFKIIELNILGKEGKNLYKKVFQLYKYSKFKRNQIITLIHNNKTNNAIEKIKNNSTIYFKKLSMQAKELYLYAKNKADDFKKNSDEIYNDFLSSMIIIGFVLVSMFVFVTYFVIKRISKHMSNSDKLTTELISKQNELINKQNELETIIMEAPNPIMVHNETGKIMMLNKVWEQLTGYTYNEINTIDKWVNKAYGDKQDIIKNKITNLYSLKEKADQDKYDIKTKDGRTIIWRFSAAPLGLINGKRTVISTALDITELKQKDDLIVIQSRYAAMGEMLSMIAHQWRQPLSVISMHVNNILLDLELDEIKEKELSNTSYSILHQITYLSNTIEDFKNFFIKDNTKEEFLLEDIFEDTQKIISASLNSHFVSLDIQYDKNIKIIINKRELVQVLINLITNAKDAFLEHKKDVEKRIQINAKEEENTLKITVCDNGGGIDENIIDKIFDPYFSTKKSLNGTGLGLYMCKTIVTQHFNGNISVKNTSEGACFEIVLIK